MSFRASLWRLHDALNTASPFDPELVVTGKGETRTGEFKKINSKGRLPVLTKADRLLTEIPAILLHLASENTVFAPKGQEQVSRTLEWFNW